MRSNEENSARQILSNVLGVSVDLIKSDAGIGTLREWDSLAHLRLILFLEEMTGEKIETDVMLNIIDLKSLENYISQKL